MIDAEQVQDGGVQIVDVHGPRGKLRVAGLRFQDIAVVIHDVVAVIVRPAVGDARFDAAARQPDAEAARENLRIRNPGGTDSAPRHPVRRCNQRNSAQNQGMD